MTGFALRERAGSKVQNTETKAEKVVMEYRLVADFRS